MVLGIVCPWCGHCDMVGRYTPLQRPRGREHEFAWELRCPMCSWKFAPVELASVVGTVYEGEPA